MTQYEWVLTNVDYIAIKRGSDSVPLTWLKRREIPPHPNQPSAHKIRRQP